MLIKDPPIQINDSLLMLGTNEYPLYLAKGPNEGAIFEGGVGAMGPVLQAQLERLHVTGDFVRQVIVTHAHPDHVMAVPLFREIFPYLTVCASEQAATALSAEKAVTFFAKVDQAFTASLIERGAIDNGLHPEPFTGEKIAVDRIINEGDTINVDHLAFQVLRTPGHSDCSLSFYEPAIDCLLISDATGYYIPQHNYWWPNYFTGYAPYLASIRRLATLRSEFLCLSHNAVIKGENSVKAYFDGALAATENYHKRIISEYKAGKAPRQIAEQLGAEAFEKVRLLDWAFFQKNCALLVKLSLKHEGIKPDK
ncbi:MAG: MBL fold metallo-hydrolase [Phycisphaerae bacterium]|nr:MBL fold metallo-hydrolase [Phycisphaerae bacterium]